MQTINTKEAVVIHNIELWQNEKKKRLKRKERLEFKNKFNNVGEVIVTVTRPHELGEQHTNFRGPAFKSGKP